MHYYRHNKYHRYPYYRRYYSHYPYYYRRYYDPYYRYMNNAIDSDIVNIDDDIVIYSNTESKVEVSEEHKPKEIVMEVNEEEEDDDISNIEPSRLILL